MNEDHIIAAILAAGLIARNKDEEMQPKDVVTIYEMTLASLLDSTRPHRSEENL